MLKIITMICFLIFATNESIGQKFDFGLSSRMLVSQVDGDNLTGFRKLGYEVGVLGGYSFRDRSSLIVRQSFSNIGSKSSGITVDKDDYVIEFDLFIASLDLGYSFTLLSDWEEVSLLNLTTGIKFQRIISNNSILTYNSFREDLPIDINNLKSWSQSVFIGISKRISKRFLANLEYNQGLTDLNNDEDLFSKKLKPYYFSFGLQFDL